jgi:hypothetical protein
MNTVPATPSDVNEQRGVLPAQFRLLCVSVDEPSWTVLALLLDKHGCHEPQFRWCETGAQALSLLREETFDCLVVHDAAPTPGATSRGLAVVPFLQAVAAGGSVEPVLVVTPRANDDWLLQLAGFDCEVLVAEQGWQSHALPVWISRTVERSHVARENQRLSNADRRRHVRERDETEQLIEQQRQIINAALRSSAFIDSPADDPASAEDVSERLPEQVITYYQELLRTYVMMGSGSLTDEIRKLAQLFVVAGITPRAVLRVHLERVESLIRGLGSRSSRHVMVRADILAMELMIQVGECYREKSQRPGLGDYGIDLLHADSLRQKTGRQ